MNVNIRSKGIHNINCVVGLKLPGTSLEGVRQVVEGTDGTQIDDIAGELVGNHGFDVSVLAIILDAKVVSIEATKLIALGQNT